MHGLDDNIKMTYNGKKRRDSMKRYIAFVLSALMCTNLCACGANPQFHPVEEEPATPIVEEVVVPEESVVQEVSATPGNISLMYKGMSVRNGESIYLAEGTEMLSVSAGRKKLENYTVTSSNPNAYQYTINEDGSIALTCVGKGESIITVSTESQNAVFIACTPSNLELRFGDTVIDSETEIKIPFEDYTEKVNVIVNDKAISYFEMTASEESFFVEYEKESDGSIRMIPMRPGIFELTIDAFGVSETFKILFVDESGELSVKEHLQPQSPQTSIPPIQQIGHDYDPVIDFYQIPKGLGSPQYTVDEIKQMIADNLTLDEVAEKISTVADLVQYLHQKEYGKIHVKDGDLSFNWGKYNWHVNRSAQVVYENNEGNCGGGSNLVNYILRGDYDEQGFVQQAANTGGHIYNYFKDNGVYYFMDLIQIVQSGDYCQSGYRIYSTSTPKEFSDYYIGNNLKRYNESDEKYLLLHYMYPYDGSHLPIGRSEYKTICGTPYNGILPKEIENQVTILYLNESAPQPKFVKSPPQSEWPKEAR